MIVDNMVQKIKAEAERLGFSLFGITFPERPAFFDQYSKWLALKQFGDMDYLANPRAISIKSDPRKYLMDCKSIIVLGLPYFLSGKDGTDFKQNNIASFALCPDYHKLILGKHNELGSYIKSLLPDRQFLFRCAVDSAPVLEKSLAFSAGLGWIGKNGCLINPQYGSFFFLSEIFTTLELPASKKIIDDLCGKCHRCLEACPTQCINSDRTLNAQNCLSYLSIEHKGQIDQYLCKKMGSHLFGCDICQAVCPWNQKVIKSFQSSSGLTPSIQPKTDLASCLKLSEDAFFRIYGQTPIRRTGYLRFLRNVIIAMSNSGNDIYRTALKTFIHSDSDAALKNLATWALKVLDETQS